MENPTHSFRETNLEPQLIQESGHFLYRLFCPKKTFLTFVFYLNVQCIEYTFRIYTHLYIKNITSCTFLLVFKIVENLECLFVGIIFPAEAGSHLYKRKMKSRFYWIGFSVSRNKRTHEREKKIETRSLATKGLQLCSQLASI